VITDDEVMRLFERADPARVDHVAVRIDAAGYLDALRLESDEQLVPVKEIYVSVDSPPASETRNRRRLAMAVAAVVAVIGVAAIATKSPNSDDNVEPAPAAAPTVAPTTVSPTTVAPRTETGFFDGDDGVPVTFTVPDGWGVFQGMFVYNEEACCPRFGPGPAVAFMEVTKIYAEGCLVGPPVGPTVDDLVSALANVPGLNATAAVDVTVDGYAGKQIEFTVSDYNEDECRGNPYALWYGPGDADIGFREMIRSTFDPNIPNIHNKLWILDVGGTRVVIHAYSYPDTPLHTQDRADLDEILASIQIG
jgi:hypothetical protein